MLKKAKIVNISLASSNNISSALHQFHQKANQSKDISNEDCRQQIIHNCYEALRIISAAKNSLKDQGRITQIFYESNKKLSNSVSLPFDICDSVLHILKQFLKFKVQQRQQQLISRSTKSKTAQKHQSSIKLLFNKQIKQNVLGQTKQLNSNIFIAAKNIKNVQQRLKARIKELQAQLFLFKQKLDQKNSVISQLISKGILQKNQYRSQFNKTVRNKNICNINEDFLKKLKNNTSLLNIIGKNKFNNLVDQQIQEDDPKAVSQTKSYNFSDKNFQKSNKKNSINKASTTQNIFSIASENKNDVARLINKPLSSSYSIPNIKKQDKNDQNNNCASTYISKNTDSVKLKEQLGILIKRKNRTIDELNQNSHRIQKQLEQIEKQIAQKKRQIDQYYDQDINLEDKINLQDKQLNDDFEALEMDGFYNNQIPISSNMMI